MLGLAFFVECWASSFDEKNFYVVNFQILIKMLDSGLTVLSIKSAAVDNLRKSRDEKSKQI